MRKPWNKGKKLTPEHKEAIADSLRGKAPWNKGKVGLMPIPWNKGKKLDKKIKAKISESMKGRKPWNKGKEWDEDTKSRIKAGVNKHYESIQRISRDE